ncbi:MAG: blaR1 4 [Planctomycetaceae bacterium]|nr:blaR1 4 [Planctomycetaceae bacterium]
MSLPLTPVSTNGLLDLALKSAAVMLVALLAAGILGRASAARRHLVWCLSVTSLLLLPVLSLSLPAWGVTWLPQWNSRSTESAVAEQPMQLQTERVPPFEPQPSVMVVLPPSTVAQTAEVRDSLTTEVIPESAVRSDSSLWMRIEWVPMIWLSGVLCSLVPLAVGLLQLAALRRRSRPVDDQHWLALLDELRAQLPIRRRVQLRQSDGAGAPLTWGSLQPVLLVPNEAGEWPAQRRRLVLLHELAHIRRWDWLTQLIAHLACAIYWFNPLVWLAARQMRIERERACDDLVLASGARASDYALELLTLATSLAGFRLSSLVAVSMTRYGTLEDRIRGILDIRRSRAALTAVVVCLGALMAGAAITPLAMLRAADPQLPPPTGEQVTRSEDQHSGKLDASKKVAGEADQSNPAEDPIKARAEGIAINVLNSKGDKAIPEFRVIAGVDSGSVSREFEKRTGQPVIVWQPHTCRIGKNGGYVWPLAQAYDVMAVRVEADGYQPQVFPGLKKAAGAQHIVFLLTEDKQVAGRLLTPDGKPAAGATVALALPQQDIVWEDGKLRGASDPLPEKPGDRWRRPRFFTTDAAGRFRLPTETEPAAILIIHASGVLEMAYDVWKSSPEVTLQPWGSIAGQVLWKDKPGAEEDVTLTVHRHEYGYPGMIASYAKTRTDQNGVFTFQRVLPGLVQISRPFTTNGESNTSSVILNGMFRHIKVASGEATKVLLGGQRRKVTGKFVGLDSWEGATYHFHPTAPHIGWGGGNEMWKAFGQLRKSSIGPLLFRDKQPINKDGSFSIENVLPGDYQLFLSSPGDTGYAASARIEIEPEVIGEKPAPLAIKDITARKHPAKPDDTPADKPAEKAIKKTGENPAEKPAAKTVTIRGKVVDDVTGEPIGQLITQAGKFEPGDPKKVTWGYSEGRSSARDGSFSTTIRWSEGWTARIVVAGYIPQPVVTSAPPADKDEIEVTIRLKRGPQVRGVVIDHTGKPLKDAAVFAIGPIWPNLSAGRAWSSIGGNDDEARPVKTDAQGRFELPAGEAKSVAVSHAQFDAWPATIPAEGEMTIRLPEPAHVEIDLDVEGADKESVIFYQLLSHLMPEFAGVRIEREVKIANPGKLSLAALPPGKYQVCRMVMNRLGQFSTGAMLDRQFFELKSGESKAIHYVREKGSRLRGKVTWPADVKLSGIVVSVESEKAEQGPFDKHEWKTSYASQTATADGTFLTERIAPGKYVLKAGAYTPLTQEQLFRSGAIVPAFRAQIKIEISTDGELTVPELNLKRSQSDE